MHEPAQEPVADSDASGMRDRSRGRTRADARGGRNLVWDPPNDPPMFGAATGVLLLIALAAAYLPGRSAARTNPVETLRAD